MPGPTDQLIAQMLAWYAAQQGQSAAQLATTLLAPGLAPSPTPPPVQNTVIDVEVTVVVKALIAGANLWIEGALITATTANDPKLNTSNLSKVGGTVIKGRMNIGDTPQVTVQLTGFNQSSWPATLVATVNAGRPNELRRYEANILLYKYAAPSPGGLKRDSPVPEVTRTISPGSTDAATPPPPPWF